MGRTTRDREAGSQVPGGREQGARRRARPRRAAAAPRESEEMMRQRKSARARETPRVE